MKYRMVIKGNQEDIFNVIKDNFLNDYYNAKGKNLDDSKLIKGFTYQKNIAKAKQTARYATVKLMEYDYPKAYRVEFRSDRYYKITGFHIQQVDDRKVEIIYEETMMQISKDKDGSNKFNVAIAENEEIKDAPFLKKWQFVNLSKQASKNRR